MSNIFSFYENGIKNVTPTKEIDLDEFMKILKQPNHLVDKARTISDKKERDVIKSKMNYVTFGGTFQKRANKLLINGSGYACFDIDDLPNLNELREKLILDKYVHLLFVSPSGLGLKVVVRIPKVVDNLEYKSYWISIANHFNLPEQDESCKDISRACYLSYDPNPFYNPLSEVYTEKFIPEPIKQVIISTISKENVSKSNGKSTEFLDKLKSSIRMEQILSHFGVDTTQNPTNCLFHTCSQKCLSFNSEVAHCFDSDCSGDNSWNIFSFVKKVKGFGSSEAIEWLSQFGGMQEEYQKSKQDYLDGQTELQQPMGWACSINIKKMAERYNLLNCPDCNVPFQFKEVQGFYYCPSCKISGGLKKFALLCIKHNQLEALK